MTDRDPLEWLIGIIGMRSVEMVLGRDHLKAIGQEQRNDLAVT